MHFQAGGFPFYSSTSYQLIRCCVKCESGMQIISPAGFSFIFRFSDSGSSPEELHHALLPLGWDAELGARRNHSVLLRIALARREASGVSYGAENRSTLDSKNPYPSRVFFQDS